MILNIFMKTGPKPRKITTQLLEQIEFQASRGLSQQQICHALGISETWWYDTKQKNAEISESFKSDAMRPLSVMYDPCESSQTHY